MLEFGAIRMRDTIRMFVLENFLFSHDARLLKNDASFTAMGIIDPMGIAEITAFLESNFDICIAETEMFFENLDSVDQIVAFLNRKLSRRAIGPQRHVDCHRL